jgi:hypothetical protein
VSRVTNMNEMLRYAKSFKRTLCGAAWVNSKADQANMFWGSPGKLARDPCEQKGSTTPKPTAASDTTVPATTPISPITPIGSPEVVIVSSNATGVFIASVIMLVMLIVW